MLNNGIITHQTGYDELLAEGIINVENMSDASESLGKADSSSSGDGQVALINQGVDDEETVNSRSPSDFTVYWYFLKSCGLMGMSLFFVLAAILAAERSFES